MRESIFVKYKPKLFMQRLAQVFYTFLITTKKYPFRNPYNNTIPKTLYEYTTNKGYMCDDLHQYSHITTFYRPIDIQLKDISDNVSSMRSLNFSSYKPIN